MGQGQGGGLLPGEIEDLEVIMSPQIPKSKKDTFWWDITVILAAFVVAVAMSVGIIATGVKLGISWSQYSAGVDN